LHVSKELKSWILLIALACVWGSSFILMKRAMFTSDEVAIFTDSQVGSLRMLIAAIVLLPFALQAMSKLKVQKNILPLSVVGVCGSFVPAFLFTYAETGISSGYAGMLNSFTPIFALIIGFIVFKDRLTKIQMTGVAIGAIGVVSLMLAGQDLSIKGDLTHVFAIVLATFLYAVSLNTIKHALQHLKGVEITSLSFFMILAPSIIISIFNGSFITIGTNTHAGEGLIYLGVLSIIGTAIAVVIFNQLITMSSVLFASSVTYLIPIVAVIIGLSFGEKINAQQIGSMTIVLFGIFLSNMLPKLLNRKKIQ
jgi:drug/metabolite transporter (DMT)-like permease